MKRGVVSDAMDKMPNEYKLEALELLNQAEVSEITNMKSKKPSRKLVTVGLAASLTLAVGVTVAAANGLFSMKLEDTDPTTTLKRTVLEYDEDTDTSYEVVEEVTGVENVLTFEGPDTCYGIEFKLGYLPPIGTVPGGEFGDPYDWNTDFLQFESGTGAVNICVFYDPQFGDDGCLFFNDKLYNIETSTSGDYEVYKFSDTYEVEYDVSVDPEYYAEIGINEGDAVVYNTNYIIMHHPSGYILVVSGSEDMSLLQSIADGIEVRQTDRVVETEDFSEHNFEITRGVG